VGGTESFQRQMDAELQALGIDRSPEGSTMAPPPSNATGAARPQKSLLARAGKAMKKLFTPFRRSRTEDGNVLPDFPSSAGPPPIYTTSKTGEPRDVKIQNQIMTSLQDPRFVHNHDTLAKNYRVSKLVIEKQLSAISKNPDYMSVLDATGKPSKNFPSPIYQALSKMRGGASEAGPSRAG
jgi:hypothetical protein